MRSTTSAPERAGVLRELVLGCVGLTASLAAFAQVGRRRRIRCGGRALRSRGPAQQPFPAEARVSKSSVPRRHWPQPAHDSSPKFRCRPATRAPKADANSRSRWRTTLNPVYSTLNDLLAAQGQPAQFPQISDVTVQFLREEEQDTRVVVRQPLYAPAIPAAVRAQRALLDASSFNRMAVARALRRDITIAYLDWLKARSSVEIVAASQALLRENLRVNRIAVRQRQDHRRPGAAREGRAARRRAAAARDREPRDAGAQLLQLPAESRSAGARSSRPRRRSRPPGNKARSNNCGPPR